MSEDHSKPPDLCSGCRWGQVGRSACFYRPVDPDDLAFNRMMLASYSGTCHAFEAGQPKAKAKPSREERDWAERKALRAERDAAVARAEALGAEVSRLRAMLGQATPPRVARARRVIASDSAGPPIGAEVDDG